MNIIKRFWKYMLGAIVVIGGSGILIANVMASNDPVINLGQISNYNLASGDEVTLTASVTIPNYNSAAITPIDTLIASNLVWKSNNNQVIGIRANTGDEFSDTAKGATITAKAMKSGRTQVFATFYYKLDRNGNVTDDIYTDGASDFQSIEVNFNTSFTCVFASLFDPEGAYEEGRVYKPNQELSINGNTYSSDPISVTSSNQVLSGTVRTFERATITINKGGVGNVYVGPQSAYDVGSGIFIDNLFRKITIYGQVLFDDGLYILSSNNYGPQTIASNIDTSDNAQVVYETTNNKVATMNKSVLTPLGAGKATITAGIKDSSGSYFVYTSSTGSDDEVPSYDTIDVIIPFVWLDNGTGKASMTQNINVGDSFQLLTNATSDSSVTFSSSKSSVASVTSDGYVTAKSGGTTEITAKVVNGSFSETISATINVVDTFTLNAAAYSMCVGDRYELEAMGSADGAVITFEIDGVPAANATGGLTGAVNEDNGKILTVTAVAEGTYTVTAKQTINSMVKTATCVITVQTAVTDVTISPSTLNMNVDDTATLRVTVGPNTAYNKNVVWVSSDNSVVSVDNTSATEYEAVVTALKGGVATITVVSVADGTKYATCTINVREPVTGISLNESSVTVNMNTIPEYMLLATVYPESTGMTDGVNRNVTWSSTDESVLTVSQSGLVTFVAPGTAAVVVTTEDGAFQAFCNFIVSVPVEEVRITSEDLILNVGEEVALTAEVLPLTASNRTIEWSSTDENVVTIDSNGTVKAVNAGHCAVFARTLDGAAQDYINVYVRQPVSNITLNTNAISVPKGTVFWLYATILPEDADVKDVTWSTSDPTMATVGTDGMITALMPGVVTITATSVDTGDSDYCVVSITEPVTGINLLTGDNQTLFVGAQFTIVPEVLPVDALNKNVTYVSSNTSIATVDENGVVTAVMGGECDIIVTTEERHLKAICHITVKEYLSTITLDRTFSYINIGDFTDLIATTTTDTATNKNIVWRTANSGIASVDQTGRVTAVAYGTTVITAVAEDGGGATATCVITVVEPVRSISLSRNELRMISGDTYILNATVSPSNASVKTLRWESTDTSVATVDADGEITAVAGGKCRIYAYSTDGNEISAYCTVYVTDVTNATSIALNSSAITIKVGENRTLTAKSTPTEITEELGWYSTDTGIVTVDQLGNIKGIAEGTANIVVYGKTSGVEGICKVTVESSVIKATAIKINSSEITMLTGKTRTLVIRLLPTNSTEGVKWYSTDTSVVVVDSNGKISTVGPGHAEVIAVSGTTGLEASCIVHSMAISRSAVTLQQYDPFMLYVDGAPSAVSWRTNNPRVATVSSTGEVIGRKEGTTTITATVDGKTLTCTVTITEATIY